MQIDHITEHCCKIPCGSLHRILLHQTHHGGEPASHCHGAVAAGATLEKHGALPRSSSDRRGIRRSVPRKVGSGESLDTMPLPSMRLFCRYQARPVFPPWRLRILRGEFAAKIFFADGAGRFEFDCRKCRACSHLRRRF